MTVHWLDRGQKPPAAGQLAGAHFAGAGESALGVARQRTGLPRVGFVHDMENTFPGGYKKFTARSRLPIRRVKVVRHVQRIIYQLRFPRLPRIGRLFIALDFDTPALALLVAATVQRYDYQRS